MDVTYTEELFQDILERLSMQAVMCNAKPDTKPAINIMEALALLAEIDRLNTRLSIAGARLGRVARNHPAVYEQALAGDDQ